MTLPDSTLRRRIAELLRAAQSDLDESGVLAMDILEASGLALGADRGRSSTEPRQDPEAPEDTSSPARKVEALSIQREPVIPIEGEFPLRYDLRELLGEGGMGEVRLAFDRNLGREVAVKSIPPDRLNQRRLSRFVNEARITAQLEHPGIVPVHDLFISESGDVFYTMKRVQGRTLRELIDDLRRGDPETIRRYTPAALIGIFRSACQAVAYAHQQGYIHRDLKPDNIMLGDFGEVLLMDWGVARAFDDDDEEPLEAFSPEEGVTLHSTLDGAVVGSPAYMAPESLQGRVAELGPQSDVFSLGVILYELLTLRRPFGAENLARLMYLVVRGEFVPPAECAPEREIPDEVQEICMRALAPAPESRFQDAGGLAERITSWLEGVGPRQEADRLVREGRELLAVYQSRAAEAEEALLRATTLKSELKPWDPLKLKRLAWEAEQEHADTMAAADRVFGDCEAAFESALSHVPGHRPSRLGLADLYWLRFLEAEESRNARWMRRWEELVRRYAGDAYAERLQGQGSLRLSIHPGSATAELLRMRDVDGRLVPGAPEELRRDGLGRVRLPMGSYQLQIEAPGHAPAVLPVLVQRLQNVEIGLSLPREESLPEGFVFVPASNVVLGGDPEALSGLPETVAHVDCFAISRFPVTCGEYFEFLQTLAESSPLEALQRTPRRRGAVESGDGPLFDPSQALKTGFPVIDREGRTWEVDQPVVGIGADDARAYAAWRNTVQPGFAFRLPTESEWEKAARGVDRRPFPWGQRFDANFCVMAESSERPPSLPRIGASPTDRSPYGLYDIAGGVRDWVEWDAESEHNEGYYPARGGSFSNVEIYSRCASRSVRRDDHVGFNIGFRLASDLPNSDDLEGSLRRDPGSSEPA